MAPPGQYNQGAQQYPASGNYQQYYPGYQPYYGGPPPKSNVMTLLGILAVVIALIVAIFFGLMCSSMMNYNGTTGTTKDRNAEFSNMFYKERIGKSMTAAPDYHFLVMNMTFINSEASQVSYRVKYLRLAYSGGGYAKLSQPCTDALSTHPDVYGFIRVPGYGRFSANLCFELPQDKVPASVNYYTGPETSGYRFKLDATKIQDWVNHPPKADAGPDRTVFLDQEVTFDGSKSSDPDTTEFLEYKWSISGPGGTDLRKIFSTSFSATGSYVVTLTVTDEFGACSVDSINVTVRFPLEITIIGYGWENDTKSANYEHMWVKMLIKDNGPVPYFFNTLQSEDFQVTTTNGTKHAQHGYNQTYGILESPISPGVTDTWVTYYDIPLGQTPRTLFFRGLTVVF